MTQPGVPTSEAVNKLHSNSDLDTSTNSQHHTLGIGQNQASPGSHTHNGKNSKKIGKGLDVAFPTTANAAYSQAQMQSVIDALRDLGLGT
jgi:hypothetical protein